MYNAHTRFYCSEFSEQIVMKTRRRHFLTHNVDQLNAQNGIEKKQVRGEMFIREKCIVWKRSFYT